MLDVDKVRILLIDDNEAIHEDFRKVLLNHSVSDPHLETTKAALFGKQDQTSKVANPDSYILESAFQGQEALEMVKESIKTGQPYAMAFVDIRMPPGWDGVETIQKIWEVDPEIQMAICTAHSDYSWNEMASLLKSSENFLILKKPFDIIEIQQLAASLTKKWILKQQLHYQIDNLQVIVSQRTQDLTLTNANLEKSLSLTQATLDSTQEGIIAVDVDNTIISHNKVFNKLWHLTDKDFLNTDAKKIFHIMSNQVVDGRLFLEMITNLVANPKKENIREWKLKNDNIFELYTQPRYIRQNENAVGCVLSFRDITDRKILEEQLVHQATHDSLTNLPNRILLTDRIEQAVMQAKRRGSLVAVLMFDLDNFKQINDSLGHNTGDKLLQEVAKKLCQSVRESDTVARLGGDEFVVVLVSEAREESIITKTHQLLDLFSASVQIDEHIFTTTASIGVALYSRDGSDADTLLKNADTALYHAKELGKNTFTFYQAEFNEQILKRTELTNGLRNALERNEFVIYYQPLADLKTGEISGMEALIRWMHPVIGLIQPNSFIPIAEETGLIAKIGEWVLKNACKQNVEWQKIYDKELTIAVNVSAYQFRQKNFVDIVKNALEESKLKPELLELEMTESMILGKVSDVTEKMSDLKKLGVRLSLDDFGTGYASLSYLKYFPFDKVKIDKIFIDGISKNTEDSSIVEAIIKMTSKMGLMVLAEGVEEKEQLDFLKLHHSDQIQGFYYSHPLTKKECGDLLQKQSHEEKI